MKHNFSLNVFLILAISLFLSISNSNEIKLKWNSNKLSLTDLIEQYSKATGQKFLVDATVRGMVGISSQEPLTQTEAFDFLSKALAMNGFTWIKQNNVFIVRNARSAQRDGVPTYKTTPPAFPEHMATLQIVLKNRTAESVKNELGRMLNSSYGEIESYKHTNTLIISDFTSSLVRISELIAELDQKLVEPKK